MGMIKYQHGRIEVKKHGRGQLELIGIVVDVSGRGFQLAREVFPSSQTRSVENLKGNDLVNGKLALDVVTGHLRSYGFRQVNAGAETTWYDRRFVAPSLPWPQLQEDPALVRDLDEFLAQNPDDAVALTAKAFVLLLNEHDPEAAQRYSERALQLWPDLPGAMAVCSAALQWQDRNREAYDLAGRALAINPDFELAQQVQRDAAKELGIGAIVEFAVTASYADGVLHQMYDSRCTLTNERLMVVSTHPKGKGRVVAVQIPEISTVTVWFKKEVRVEIGHRATVNFHFRVVSQVDWFRNLLNAAMSGGLPAAIPGMPS
jgi:hypothetical protein